MTLIDRKIQYKLGEIIHIFDYSSEVEIYDYNELWTDDFEEPTWKGLVDDIPWRFLERYLDIDQEFSAIGTGTRVNEREIKTPYIWIYLRKDEK